MTKECQMVSLGTIEEGRQTIRAALRKRDSWVFLPLDEAGMGLTTQIEKKFYSGKKNAAFELLMFPLHGRIIVVCLAKKKYMTREQLSALSGVPVETMGQRDVVHMGWPESLPSAELVTQWLNDRAGEEPVGGLIHTN